MSGTNRYAPTSAAPASASWASRSALSGSPCAIATRARALSADDQPPARRCRRGLVGPAAGGRRDPRPPARPRLSRCAPMPPSATAHDISRPGRPRVASRAAARSPAARAANPTPMCANAATPPPSLGRPRGSRRPPPGPRPSHPGRPVPSPAPRGWSLPKESRREPPRPRRPPRRIVLRLRLNHR